MKNKMKIYYDIGHDAIDLHFIYIHFTLHVAKWGGVQYL